MGKSLAPYLTDQRGRMQVTDEEAIRIAAAYEQGAVHLPAGTSIERDAHRLEMLRTLSRWDHARDSVDRAAAPHLQTHYVEQAIQAGMKIARDRMGTGRTGAGSAQPEPAMIPARKPAVPTTQPQTRTESIPITNNYGTMHFAPDDRFAKVQRMTAAG